MIIGLTGNIGAGKSLAASILAELGAAIIDADKLGHAALRSDGAAYGPVVAAFGRDFLDEEGEIIRRSLGAYVFADASGQRQRLLNSITHPVITVLVQEDVDRAKREGYNLIVVEAALLLSSPLVDMVDRVWVITAERDTLLDRVCLRDHCSREQAAQRLDSQMEAGRMIALADRVFFNQGDKESLRRELTQACEELQ